MRVLHLDPRSRGGGGFQTADRVLLQSLRVEDGTAYEDFSAEMKATAGARSV